MKTSIPSHWNSESAKNTIEKLNKFLELRSENDNQQNIQQVRKKYKLKK